MSEWELVAGYLAGMVLVGGIVAGAKGDVGVAVYLSLFWPVLLVIALLASPALAGYTVVRRLRSTESPVEEQD